MQPRLQRGPALIDLYDPYPANRGLMGRDLWAKVLELGGSCASRMFGQLPFPPGHLLPPSTSYPIPIQPVSLKRNTAVKGGLAQWD